MRPGADGFLHILIVMHIHDDVTISIPIGVLIANEIDKVICSINCR